MIKKIIIKIDETVFELTPKQARTLYEELDEMYGKKVIDYYYPYYSRPYYRRWDYPFTIPLHEYEWTCDSIPSTVSSDNNTDSTSSSYTIEI